MFGTFELAAKKRRVRLFLKIWRRGIMRSLIHLCWVSSAAAFAKSAVPAAPSPPTSSLTLDLTQSQYLSGRQTSAQNAANTNLRILGQWRSGRSVQFGGSGLMEGVLGGAFNQLYYAVPELYMGFGSAQPSIENGSIRVTVGRQRRHWSRFDEEFNMGVWQPQLRWDYLDPIQQGLTGIFFDMRASNFSASFFTSPVYLPDQGPDFELSHGQFRSPNRWFFEPQSRIGLFDTGAALRYKLDRPAEEDVILQSSFGGILRYDPPGPFWTQLSYAYKPLNQLHLGIECSQCFDINSTEATATIHPVVAKHRVVTWEAGWDTPKYSGWVSATSDTPHETGLPTDWEESSLNPTVFLGGSFEHVLPWWRGTSKLKYSYMKRFETKTGDTDPLTGDQVESSLDRYPYRELAAVEWTWRAFYHLRDRFFIKARYDYSIPERGSWLSARLAWVHRQWTYRLGMDILGTEVDPSSKNAGLFTQFRSNDRVFGGLSYAF